MAKFDIAITAPAAQKVTQDFLSLDAAQRKAVQSALGMGEAHKKAGAEGGKAAHDAKVNWEQVAGSVGMVTTVTGGVLVVVKQVTEAFREMKRVREESMKGVMADVEAQARLKAFAGGDMRRFRGLVAEADRFEAETGIPMAQSAPIVEQLHRYGLQKDIGAFISAGQTMGPQFDMLTAIKTVGEFRAAGSTAPTGKLLGQIAAVGPEVAQGTLQAMPFAGRLGLKEQDVMALGDALGPTFAAQMPMLLMGLLRSGKMKPGDKLADIFAQMPEMEFRELATGMGLKGTSAGAALRASATRLRESETRLAGVPDIAAFGMTEDERRNLAIKQAQVGTENIKKSRYGGKELLREQEIQLEREFSMATGATPLGLNWLDELALRGAWNTIPIAPGYRAASRGIMRHRLENGDIAQMEARGDVTPGFTARVEALFAALDTSNNRLAEALDRNTAATAENTTATPAAAAPTPGHQAMIVPLPVHAGEAP